MKRMKRLTAMLLVLVMMFTMAPAAMAAQPTFTDVPAGHTFYNAVMWAVEKNITQGINATQFGPTYGCTRGQVVTFLWRNAGQPEPTVTENPFTDVDETSPFYKAILWAVENNITGGYSDGTFRPKATCTRGQIVTFLYRAAGSPALTVDANPFRDVSSSSPYYNAILWAVVEGITTGISATAFGPGNTCTRGQVVTFMYRASDDYVPPKPVAPPTSAADRFEIAAVNYLGLNSVDGVKMQIYWRNNTGKTINYINFYVRVYDLNGRLLSCEVSGDTLFKCYTKGPFESGESRGWYYVGSPPYEGATYSHFFNQLDYDELYDRYYYGYPDRIYVSPADENHTYNHTGWEAFCYNGRTGFVKVEKVVLEYQDGTMETIHNPVVGPRTNPAQDKIYTQQLYNSLGCDVVGHLNNPTCTEFAYCSRCKQTLPPAGHTWTGYHNAYCEVCYTSYEPDVTLVKHDFPKTIYATDIFGHEYSVRMKNVYFDPEWELVSSADYEGEVKVSGWVYCTYEFGGAGNFFYSDCEVFIDFVDENGNVVAIHEFSPSEYDKDHNDRFHVDLPGNGTYYVDVRLEGDKSKCDKHDWGRDNVCTVCDTRRVPVNNLVDPLDYIEIADATVCVGDDDEVCSTVYFRNNTGKEIKRIDFYKSILDENGNVLSCDLNNDTVQRCYMDTPISAGNVAENFDNSAYCSDDGIDWLVYDEVAKANYYWRYDEDTGYLKTFVHPDNANRTYIDAYWSDIMRNPDAVDVRIDKVEIQFKDGTTAVYYEPKVGARNDISKDVAYTEAMMEQYGCEVFDHYYDNSNICSRCGNVYTPALPVVGGELPEPEIVSTDVGEYRFAITGFELDESVPVTWETSGGNIFSKAVFNMNYEFENVSGSAEGEKRTVYIILYNDDIGTYANQHVHIEPGQTSVPVEVDFLYTDGTYVYEMSSEPYDAEYWEGGQP